MWVSSFCICIVSLLVMISFSGLHSDMDMCVSGIIVGDGMNLVSLGCTGEKCVFMMFL